MVGHRKRVSPKRKSVVTNQKEVITAEIPANQEELFIRRILQQPRKSHIRGLEIQDVLYNSAPELRELAFKSGYNVGSEAYRISKNGGIAPLEHMLENAGFGKVIYHSFESMSTFTAYAPRPNAHNMGMNIHVFETGLISGYLSAHLGRNIAAAETSCVFNGASHCMFVAKAHAFADPDAYRYLTLEEILSALSYSLSRAQKHQGDTYYYAVSLQPLLNEPVHSEATKFLYMLGKLLALQKMRDQKSSILNRSDCLKIENAKVSSSKKGLRVSLAYSHASSSGRIVDLTTSFLSGFIKGTYGRNVQVTRSLSSRGVYNVRLELMV